MIRAGVRRFTRPISVTAAVLVVATVVVANGGSLTREPIWTNVYLGGKRVGLVTGDGDEWRLGGNRCDFTIEASARGELSGKEGIGEYTDRMRRASPTRWNYRYVGRVGPGLMAPSGYTLRVNRLTWNVFSTDRSGRSKKIGHVVVAPSNGASPELVTVAGPAGALSLLMTWQGLLYCFK